MSKLYNIAMASVLDNSASFSLAKMVFVFRLIYTFILLRCVSFRFVLFRIQVLFFPLVHFILIIHTFFLSLRNWLLSWRCLWWAQCHRNTIITKCYYLIVLYTCMHVIRVYITIYVMRKAKWTNCSIFIFISYYIIC